MSTVNGYVKAKSSNKFGYGILVNDKWYNSKDEPSCAKGDYVTFDDGGKNYINGLSKTTAPAGSSADKPSYASKSGGYNRGVFPVPKMGDGARSIIRQNALTNAVATVSMVMSSGITAKVTEDKLVEMVFKIARQYEAYSAGDIDAEAAKAVESYDVS
jgi:hypothetical protein